MTLVKYLAVFCLVPGSFLAVALVFFALDLLARVELAAARERVGRGRAH
jgi:hypothetical protein